MSAALTDPGVNEDGSDRFQPSLERPLCKRTEYHQQEASDYVFPGALGEMWLASKKTCSRFHNISASRGSRFYNPANPSKSAVASSKGGVFPSSSAYSRVWRAVFNSVTSCPRYAPCWRKVAR
jgi:hypothetical protein